MVDTFQKFSFFLGFLKCWGYQKCRKSNFLTDNTPQQRTIGFKIKNEGWDQQIFWKLMCGKSKTSVNFRLMDSCVCGLTSKGQNEKKLKRGKFGPEFSRDNGEMCHSRVWLSIIFRPFDFFFCRCCPSSCRTWDRLVPLFGCQRRFGFSKCH